MSKHNSNLTKSEIVQAVSKNCKLKKQLVANLLDDLLEEIIKSLEKNIKIKLSKFGNFSVRNKKQRYGRNPRTKQPAVISARTVVSFKAQKTLIENINIHNSN